MVTNGKSINVDSLAEWIYLMNLCCSDNDISGVGFSFDRFHRDTFNWKQMKKQERNYERLQEKIKFEYGIVKEYKEDQDFITQHSDSSWGSHSLIAEGRGKETGGRDNRIEIFEEDEYNYNGENTTTFSETQLYLSSNGNIVAGCDWSYRSIDYNRDIKIAHIDDINSQDDLIEAIRAYNNRTAKTLQVA
jgi:hypothetical protein